MRKSKVQRRYLRLREGDDRGTEGSDIAVLGLFVTSQVHLPLECSAT